MTINEFIDDLEWYKKIEVLRVAKGWSQQEAAEKCGTNQKVFWLWEKGSIFPRKNSRRAIANAFGVSEEEIFGTEEIKRRKVGG